MMSETPPAASPPDPGPDSDLDADIEDDERGLLEFYDVIKVKKLPKAFEQDGIAHYSDTTFISSGQDLRDMESYEDPKDPDDAVKVKTPGLEIQRFLMWKSYVQYYAIRHDGVASRPSQTSNAESRDCSTLHIGADPHEHIPGTSAPTTIAGSSTAPTSPLRPLPHPPRAVTTPAENFQRGIKRDIAHYEESKRDDQWDEWSVGSCTNALKWCIGLGCAHK